MPFTVVFPVCIAITLFFVGLLIQKLDEENTPDIAWSQKTRNVGTVLCFVIAVLVLMSIAVSGISL